MATYSTLPTNTASLREVAVSHAIPAPEQRSLERYILVLLKYYRPILLVAALGVMLSILVAVTTPRTYRAGSLVRIGTHTPLLPGTAVEDIMRQQTAEENYFVTEVEEIKSLPIADSVLDDPEVKSALAEKGPPRDSFLTTIKKILNPLNWFRSSGSQEGDPAVGGAVYKHSLQQLMSYLSKIGVSQVKMTALVEISASSSDPKLAALLANAHTQHYIDFITNHRKKEFEANVSFLRSQAADLETKISAVEQEMTQYAEANSIISLDNDETVNTRQISELTKLLTEATSRRITAENNLTQAKSDLGRASTFVDDLTSDALRQRISEAEAEYARDASRFTAEYPRMKELRARINSLQQNLKARKEQALNTLDAKYRAEREVEQNLREQLDGVQTRLFELSRVKVKYNQMAREFESLKDLLQTVLRQLQQVDISVGGVRANVSIVAPAPVPTAPAGPRRMLIVVGGSFVGLILGLILAVVLDFFDNSIKTTGEMGEVLHAPELGMIPSVAKDLPASGFGDGDISAGHETLPPCGSLTLPGSIPVVSYPHALFSATAPRSVAAEAIRTLRVSIRLVAPDEQLRMIAVTSAVEKEGKSTVAANLALSFAADGVKTILLDADLRKPVQSQLFGLDCNLPGLVDFISGGLGVQDVILGTQFRKLDILSAGMRVSHPSELLGSRKMADILAILRAEYEMVIIDTTPVLPVADALILSQQVDGMIYVVRCNKTPQRISQQGMARLRQAKAPVLGAVLNDMPLDRADVAFLYRGSYEYEVNESDRWAGNA